MASYSGIVSSINIRPGWTSAGCFLTLTQSDGTKIGSFLIDKGSDGDSVSNCLFVACAAASNVTIWTDGDMTDGYDHINSAYVYGPQ
jgi:hypothetical protein